MKKYHIIIIIIIITIIIITINERHNDKHSKDFVVADFIVIVNDNKLKRFSLMLHSCCCGSNMHWTKYFWHFGWLFYLRFNMNQQICDIHC
jgi:hypothetical protein